MVKTLKMSDYTYLSFSTRFYYLTEEIVILDISLPLSKKIQDNHKVSHD